MGIHMPIRAMTLLLLASCAGCFAPTGELTTIFGDSAAVESVENATAVSAYRLASSSHYREVLADYEAMAGPIDLSTEQTFRLRQVLLDPSSYGWNMAKSCIPNYGVRVRFQHGVDEVDVLLCFECDILTVYHNGTGTGGEDFDDARSEILTVVKELFPDDPDIQSLK